MPLTLGSTGMDASTETALRQAFEQANAATGQRWRWQGGSETDYIVVDMDSLYGPMSWLQLHAAGRRVIGLTANARSQTDFRLPRPFGADDLAVLLSEIADERGVAMIAAPTAAVPSGLTPAPAPADVLPPAPAMSRDEEQRVMPMPADTPVARADAPAPSQIPAAIHTEVAVPEVPRERRLWDWLRARALLHRVRLQAADGSVLLIDPQSRTYHASTALKPLGAFFEPVLADGDLPAADPAQWQTDVAALGAAQPLARLEWLGALLAGQGALLPGTDPNGEYRLLKWPQTEREFPKHFRIATAMMKGPATVAQIAQLSSTTAADVADFINANIATGFAEFAPPPAPEQPEPPKPAGGLFSRMRSR